MPASESTRRVPLLHGEVDELKRRAGAAGFDLTVEQVDGADVIVITRWSLSREFSSLDAAEAFVDRIEGHRP